MTWKASHRQSELLATSAHALLREGKVEDARQAFKQAAEAEVDALGKVSADQPRTLGITGVSAVALWFKAHELRAAERLAHELLARPELNAPSSASLRELLQSIWNEHEKETAGLDFVPGAVLVSVKGGEVLRGGAPLDLIVEKVQVVQSIFYRTIEYLGGAPLRLRGAPVSDIQEQCRPWIFQEAPGSYQFSIAIQKPRQTDLFKQTGVSEAEIAEKFLRIVAASVGDTETDLRGEVSDTGYQTVFLKLARNLAPTEKTTSFREIEVRSPRERHGVTLRSDSRKKINETLRARTPPRTEAMPDMIVELRGRLRRLDLDHDWIVIDSDSGPLRIEKITDAADDILGPMVNKAVVVRAAVNAANEHRYLDIELE